MKQLLTIPALIFLACNALAGSADDEAFEKLTFEYIGDLTNFSPANATLIGDHSADSRLDNVDAAARARRRDLYEDYKAALAAIDRGKLTRANQIDAEILYSEIELRLWSLDTLQEWAWNPLVYINLSGRSIYGLVTRDFAPIRSRLVSTASRLEQLPRFLGQARGSLQPERVPKIHAETAIKQNRGLVSIIESMVVPEMAVLSSGDRNRLVAAIKLAKDAISKHQTWLEEELLPRAAGNFRIGVELYDAKLAFALNSPMSRREVRARAESEYQSIRNQMYEIAREIYAEMHPLTAFPDDPAETYKQAIVRTALEKAYQQLPPRDGIVAMPDDPVEIIIMPEFQRGIALAYQDPPGPLDKGQKSFYAVAPLPEDWTDEQVTSFLREYNLLSIQDLTIHEGVPGHYLQIALSNRYPSALRSVLRSGPFVEGWAVYAERMMIDEGYLDRDPLMRLINLKWYLRTVTNAIIDSAIHVDGMTRDQAMKLMIEGGFQEEREAAGKWIRAQLTSAQLSMYFVGYQEHIEMRGAVEQAWGDEFTLRRYHDQALSYGSPPVRFVRALMLGEDIPQSDN